MTHPVIGSMAAEFRRARIWHGAIDASIHARRAQKSSARGHHAAARMLIGRSAMALVRVTFALEGRWAPQDQLSLGGCRIERRFEQYARGSCTTRPDAHVGY